MTPQLPGKNSCGNVPAQRRLSHKMRTTPEARALGLDPRAVHQHHQRGADLGAVGEQVQAGLGHLRRWRCGGRTCNGMWHGGDVAWAVSMAAAGRLHDDGNWPKPTPPHPHQPTHPTRIPTFPSIHPPTHLLRGQQPAARLTHRLSRRSGVRLLHASHHSCVRELRAERADADAVAGQRPCQGAGCGDAARLGCCVHGAAWARVGVRQGRVDSWEACTQSWVACTPCRRAGGANWGEGTQDPPATSPALQQRAPLAASPHRCT